MRSLIFTSLVELCLFFARIRMPCRFFCFLPQAVLAHLDTCHGVPHLAQRKSLTPPAGGFGLGKSVQPLPPTLVTYFPNPSCSLPGAPNGSSTSVHGASSGSGSGNNSAASLGGAGGEGVALAAAQAFVPPHPTAHYKNALRAAASAAGLSPAYQQWLATLPTIEDAIILALPPNSGEAPPLPPPSSLPVSAARSVALAGRGLWAATGRAHDPLRLFVAAQLAHAALKDNSSLILPAAFATAGTGFTVSSSLFVTSNTTTTASATAAAAAGLVATAGGASENSKGLLGSAQAICRALNVDLSNSNNSARDSTAAMVVDDDGATMVDDDAAAGDAATAESTEWQILQALGKAPSAWRALEHRTAAVLPLPLATATAASSSTSSLAQPPQPIEGGRGQVPSQLLVLIPALARSSDSCSSLEAATALGDEATVPATVHDDIPNTQYTSDENALAAAASSSTSSNAVGSTVLGCLSSVKQVFVCGPCAPDCPIDGLSLFDVLVEKVGCGSFPSQAILKKSAWQHYLAIVRMC